MKKGKHNKHNILLNIILLFGISLFIYSSINIYMWYIDSRNTANIIDKINSFASTINENSQNNDSTEGINLSKYKEINPDTIGWIQVNGTDVNYPFTQTSDNNFYLKHSFDKSNNSAGWVFLDYRNNIDNFDKNTILYAHGRLDKTMFGSLKNVFEPVWYNDSNNHVIKLSTETKTTTWQIFSVYHIPATSDYIKTNFESEGEFESFIKMIQNRSTYNFNTITNNSDNILTLSTCYNNNSKERLVIHAKLNK